jgi:hypothetical protein
MERGKKRRCRGGRRGIWSAGVWVGADDEVREAVKSMAKEQVDKGVSVLLMYGKRGRAELRVSLTSVVRSRDGQFWNTANKIKSMVVNCVQDDDER